MCYNRNGDREYRVLVIGGYWEVVIFAKIRTTNEQCIILIDRISLSQISKSKERRIGTVQNIETLNSNYKQ